MPKKPLPVRFEEALIEQLRAKAAASNLRLTDYVTNALTGHLTEINRLESLVRMIEISDFDSNKSILLELLLLGRHSASKSTVSEVHAAMKFYGVEPWRNKSEREEN